MSKQADLNKARGELTAARAILHKVLRHPSDKPLHPNLRNDIATYVEPTEAAA